MENLRLKVLPKSLLVALERKVATDTESELEQEYASRCEVCRNGCEEETDRAVCPHAFGPEKTLLRRALQSYNPA